MVHAAWIPGWYELDQPLEVGAEGEFIFWRVVPDYLGNSKDLVFYNTLWHERNGVFGTGKISEIRHPQLGNIRKIDTRGLGYTITLLDGTEFLVNAEEEPGKMFEGEPGDWTESRRVISDWQCEVTFEALSELSTESKCR
jgi:hypothetical protein